MKKIFIIVLLLLLVLGLYACKESDEQQSIISIQKYELNKISIDSYDSFVGHVCEKERWHLVGEYGGLIVDDVKVIKGQKIKKGDIICTFNQDDLESRILYLKKYLSGNIEGITDAEISLYGEDYLKLESISQIKEEIEKLKLIQDKPYIESDCVGVVLDLNIENGAKITNNIIADIGIGKQILIYVSDKQQVDYFTGMCVRIFSKSHSEQYIEGVVTEISNYKMQNGYPVLIEFVSDDLFIGSQVGIQLITDSREDVYAVPYYFLQQNEKGSYIVNENNQRIYVNVGLVTDYYVEIEAEDLKQGDFAIMSNEE
ncbi:MAG: hypothetical protein IJD40_02530 [Lachnospiraceae bacterium]|nr:hypothetical protein [Lachnospiraceae bacterium]